MKHNTSMRTLIEAVEDSEFKKGENGYVCVKLHKDDAKDLEKHLKSIGLKNYIKPADMHATLFYCEDGMELLDHDSTKNYKASTTTYSTLGEGEWKAVVLKLESAELHARHDEIKKTGAKHSYPKLTLHISLKYKPLDSDLELVKSNPFKKETLRFTNETWEDIT